MTGAQNANLKSNVNDVSGNEMDYYIDLRYYRAKIASFDTHSELVGREALIERQQAAIHLMNE